MYNRWINYSDELYHHGVKGMKWGVRKNPKKGTGRRKLLLLAIKDYIRRATVGTDLTSMHAQRQHLIDVGQMHLQQSQEVMQMSTRQAFNDMQAHINTANMHNQMHMDMHTNFINTVDMQNTMNSFYMY